MARRLVVLTGAGASHDCASDEVNKTPGRAPPLVKDLFARNFSPILERYRLAQAAATDIRRSIAPESENALPLEQYLREQMRDSPSTFTQQRYRQIPLYLQDVLINVGSTTGGGYTTEPDNYNALLNAVLELDDVLFLTLNYDTLLDGQLFLYGRFNSMHSYVTASPKWALVKLHGSVNWGRRVAFDPTETLAEIESDSLATGTSIDIFQIINKLFVAPPELTFATGEIELRLQPNLTDRRFDQNQGALFYPALSVPLGAEDELVCPPEHISAARERLSAAEALNLLVIGYSGLDQEVLRFLAESGRGVRSLLVANGTEEASAEAAERLASSCGATVRVREGSIFAGGFADLVKSGKLREFVRTLS